MSRPQSVLGIRCAGVLTVSAFVWVVGTACGSSDSSSGGSTTTDGGADSGGGDGGGDGGSGGSGSGGGGGNGCGGLCKNAGFTGGNEMKFGAVIECQCSGTGGTVSKPACESYCAKFNVPPEKALLSTDGSSPPAKCVCDGT